MTIRSDNECRLSALQTRGIRCESEGGSAVCPAGNLIAPSSFLTQHLTPQTYQQPSLPSSFISLSPSSPILISSSYTCRLPLRHPAAYNSLISTMASFLAPPDLLLRYSRPRVKVTGHFLLRTALGAERCCSNGRRHGRYAMRSGRVIHEAPPPG